MLHSHHHHHPRGSAAAGPPPSSAASTSAGYGPGGPRDGGMSRTAGTSASVMPPGGSLPSNATNGAGGPSSRGGAAGGAGRITPSSSSANAHHRGAPHHQQQQLPSHHHHHPLAGPPSGQGQMPSSQNSSHHHHYASQQHPAHAASQAAQYGAREAATARLNGLAPSASSSGPGASSTGNGALLHNGHPSSGVPGPLSAAAAAVAAGAPAGSGPPPPTQDSSSGAGGGGADSHPHLLQSVLDRGAALNSQASHSLGQGYSLEKRRRALPTPLQKLQGETEGCYVEIGSIAWSMNDYERSLLSYEEAARRNPYCLGALQGLARYWREKENHTKSLDYGSRALAIDDSGADGEMWSIVGHALLYLQQMQKAYSCYQQAIAKAAKKDDPKLWYGIGILYDRYGSMEHAEEAFASVLKMDPSESLKR